MNPAMKAKQSSFDRVMAVVAGQFQKKHGTVIGVKTWLAGRLGVSKQNLAQFERRGRFPDGYMAKISKLTGIPVRAMLGDFTDDVIDLSRKWRVSVRDAELTLISIGLDHHDKK